MITTKTTSHLKLSAQRAATWIDRLQLPLPLALVIIVFLVAGGISALGQLRSYQAAIAVPTPALPIIMIATAQPAQLVEPTPAASIAAQTGPTLPRAIVAYDAPGGQPIGALDSGRAYTVIARWGDGWLQADVAGSGLVWLRVSDLLDTNGIADVRPAPTAPPLVEPQPPAPAVVVIEAAPTPAPPVAPIAPEQPPEQPPEPAQAAGGGGKMQAPEFAPLAPASDSAAQWCAAAAAANAGARCAQP